MVNRDYRSEYLNLLNHEIPELIAGESTNFPGYAVEFSALGSSLNETLIDDKGTEYVMVKACCKLSKPDTGESLQFNVDLLKLPIFQELGFVIKGNHMQVLDLYSRTPGWHFTQKFNAASELLLATANSINNKTFSFVSDHGALYMQFKMSSKVKKVRVPVATFLRAMTGISNNDIVGMFGMENPFILRSLVSSEETSRNDCISAVITAVLGKANVDHNYTSIYSQKRELERQFFDEHYLNFGTYNRGRMDYLQSYQYRASGKILAESITVDGKVIPEGAVLSNQALQLLDASEVNILRVLYNGKRYTLHKFSKTAFQVLGYTAAEDIPVCGIKEGKKLSLADVITLNKSCLDSIRIIDVSGTQRVVERCSSSGALMPDDLLTVMIFG